MLNFIPKEQKITSAHNITLHNLILDASSFTAVLPRNIVLKFDVHSWLDESVVTIIITIIV